jgi:hypothetical protein
LRSPTQGENGGDGNTNLEHAIELPEEALPVVAATRRSLRPKSATSGFKSSRDSITLSFQSRAFQGVGVISPSYIKQRRNSTTT